MSSPGPQTFGQMAWGNFGRGFPLTGTSGMKWLCPLLLQAMTMGELSLRAPLASLLEHSGEEGGGGRERKRERGRKNVCVCVCFTLLVRNVKTWLASPSVGSNHYTWAVANFLLTRYMYIVHLYTVPFTPYLTLVHITQMSTN